MKITKSKLKQIIKEELANYTEDKSNPDDSESSNADGVLVQFEGLQAIGDWKKYSIYDNKSERWHTLVRGAGTKEPMIAKLNGTGYYVDSIVFRDPLRGLWLYMLEMIGDYGRPG
tara:strand:- start:185 stop:529 length:345 start_codon:yes stop_codon:yes gene_type:complete